MFSASSPPVCASSRHILPSSPSSNPPIPHSTPPPPPPRSPLRLFLRGFPRSWHGSFSRETSGAALGAQSSALFMCQRVLNVRGRETDRRKEANGGGWEGKGSGDHSRTGGSVRRIRWRRCGSSSPARRHPPASAGVLIISGPRWNVTQSSARWMSRGRGTSSPFTSHFWWSKGLHTRQYCGLSSS